MAKKVITVREDILRDRLSDELSNDLRKELGELQTLVGKVRRAGKRIYRKHPFVGEYMFDELHTLSVIVNKFADNQSAVIREAKAMLDTVQKAKVREQKRLTREQKQKGKEQKMADDLLDWVDNIAK